MADANNFPDAISEHEVFLIRRIRSGETELFPDLVRPYSRSLLTVLGSILRDPSDVEEVLQETMLKALVHLHQLHDEQDEQKDAEDSPIDCGHLADWACHGACSGYGFPGPGQSFPAICPITCRIFPPSGPRQYASPTMKNSHLKPKEEHKSQSDEFLYGQDAFARKPIHS
jgi:hypothetical protein